MHKNSDTLFLDNPGATKTRYFTQCRHKTIKPHTDA